jgi:hypothetical protein
VTGCEAVNEASSVLHDASHFLDSRIAERRADDGLDFRRLARLQCLRLSAYGDCK